MSDERLREDELVSAYLDNEATPAEVAEVESDDALLTRAEQFRAARDAVAAPVPPLPADRRDQMIGAALDAAEMEAQARPEHKVVPLHRPQRLLLAMAAAVVAVAAAVGAGLIATRGGDDAEEVAGRALSAEADAAPAEMASPATAPAALAEEQPRAEMEMAPAEEPTVEEESMVDESVAEAMEEAAPATAAPAATTTVAAMQAGDGDDQADPEPISDVAEAGGERSESATDEGGPGDDVSSDQVADLGALESLESLFENIGASWSAALEEGVSADPGACSGAVHERALEASAGTLRSFVATVGIDDPVTFDARFARRDDGTAVIIYAAPPDCEIGIHELPGS